MGVGPMLPENERFVAAIALHLLILLPLAGAVVVAALPERRETLVPRISLVIGVVVFVLSALLWLGTPDEPTGATAVSAVAGHRGTAHRAVAQESAPRLVGESDLRWIAAGTWGVDEDGQQTLRNGIELRYHLGLDAISSPLVALTGLLVPLSIWCSFTGIRTRVREYYAWLLALSAAMFGVFAARDVLLFYVFFEFTLVPLYFLIGIWGGPERRRAATKFFLYTFVGSMITFAGLLYLGLRAAEINARDVISFDLVELCTLNFRQLTFAEQSWLFFALFCGFAIKVPLFPLHTWLPLAHTEAPTAGSVLLAGVLLKLGTYGFLRFSLPTVPEGALAWADEMGMLAVAGIIYGALCCWVQRDVKKLVAYSSVSHLGFCMLGMFSLVPAGLSGSVLYMVNHGISTGALFLVVGMLYERYHTRDLDQIGGLARRMPVLAFFFVLFVLSSIGLPGLNGFVSEFTVLLAAFNSDVLGRWYGALGATGILLGAIYMLYATGKVLFGPVKEPPGTPDLSALRPELPDPNRVRREAAAGQGRNADLTPREIAILAPLAFLVVLLGVAPRLITDTLDPALRMQILARIDQARRQAEEVAAEKSKSRKVENSKPRNVETSKRRNVETSNCRNVETSKRRNVETSKWDPGGVGVSSRGLQPPDGGNHLFGPPRRGGGGVPALAAFVADPMGTTRHDSEFGRHLRPSAASHTRGPAPGGFAPGYCPQPLRGQFNDPQSLRGQSDDPQLLRGQLSGSSAMAIRFNDPQPLRGQLLDPQPPRGQERAAP